MSFELIQELKDAFSRAESDPQVKVIVLKANGDVFCAGADLVSLQKLQQFSFEENLADSNHLKELYLKIYTLGKVVIAQVQGHALAGGCGLASICDFVFAVPEAKFGYTEVKIGFVPALVMVFLIRRIGEQKAKQLLISGDLVTAHEALAMGLVNRLAGPDVIESEVMQFADHLIHDNSAKSMELTKQMIAHIQSLSMDEALNHAAKMNAIARSSEDCKKGIAAFLGKEKLSW